MCSRCSCHVVSDKAGRAGIWPSSLLLAIISSHQSTLPHFCAYTLLHQKKNWRKKGKIDTRKEMQMKKRHKIIGIYKK